MNKKSQSSDCEIKNFKELKEALLCGRLRWLFPILFFINLLLFMFLIGDPETPKAVYFPLMLKGRALWWAAGICQACYLILAIQNWAAWIKKRK
jgi:hypothetical protein